MTAAIYLIDTSGLFRILQAEYRQAWADELAAGVVATCPAVELEFLNSARSLADRLEKKRLLRTVFGWVPMTDRAFERAEEVQQLLTETGQHRSAGPVDLLVAATAERERLIVLCDDHDFETVASATGQPVRLVTIVRDGELAPVLGHTGRPASCPQRPEIVDDLVHLRQQFRRTRRLVAGHTRRPAASPRGDLERCYREA